MANHMMLQAVRMCDTHEKIAETVSTSRLFSFRFLTTNHRMSQLKAFMGDTTILRSEDSLGSSTLLHLDLDQLKCWRGLSLKPKKSRSLWIVTVATTFTLVNHSMPMAMEKPVKSLEQVSVRCSDDRLLLGIVDHRLQKGEHPLWIYLGFKI